MQRKSVRAQPVQGVFGSKNVTFKTYARSFWEAGQQRVSECCCSFLLMFSFLVLLVRSIILFEDFCVCFCSIVIFVCSNKFCKLLLFFSNGRWTQVMPNVHFLRHLAPFEAGSRCKCWNIIVLLGVWHMDMQHIPYFTKVDAYSRRVASPGALLKINVYPDTQWPKYTWSLSLSKFNQVKLKTPFNHRLPAQVAPSKSKQACPLPHDTKTRDF